jgi:orotate phosphoribosyltransferase
MTPEQILQKHGALLDGHFQLSSGKHSSRYLQCAVALQYPDAAAGLGVAIAERLTACLASPPDVVVSPALGGLIIGHEVGRALGVRACFTERVDGAMVMRRGFHLDPGERVVMIEDVVTTGLSSQETLAVIRELGALPVAAGCIANRSGKNRLGDLPLVSLVQPDFPVWDPQDCPLCAAGDAAVKPGSRPGA